MHTPQRLLTRDHRLRASSTTALASIKASTSSNQFRDCASSSITAPERFAGRLDWKEGPHSPILESTSIANAKASVRVPASSSTPVVTLLSKASRQEPTKKRPDRFV